MAAGSWLTNTRPTSCRSDADHSASKKVARAVALFCGSAPAAQPHRSCMLLIHQARPQSVMEVRPKLSAPMTEPALPLAMMGTTRNDCRRGAAQRQAGRGHKAQCVQLHLRQDRVGAKQHPQQPYC